MSDSTLREMLSFFGMQSDPFGRDIDTARLVQLPTVTNALGDLSFFCQRRGIGILAGKSGSGKSCLLRLLAAGLPTGLFRPVYLCHSTVTVGEFYGHLASAFNLPSRGRRAVLFRTIKDHVVQLHRTDKIHPILILDEAHALSDEILVELRQLLNFQYDSETCLSILLCGQDELLARLRLSILEPLANSITTTVFLKPLTQEETASYLEERLRQVSARPDVFSPPAVRAIHNVSHGVMRAVNTIASAGLVKAWRVKANQVESEFIMGLVGES
jgi:type II secretory pathway predicted ATPase ExeA